VIREIKRNEDRTTSIRITDDTVNIMYCMCEFYFPTKVFHLQKIEEKTRNIAYIT